MAKKSAIVKNEKRKHLMVAKRVLREELKKQAIGGNGFEEKVKAYSGLDKTKNASPIRIRNRCGISGRPRGYIGRIGLSRGAFRFYVSFGLIAGVKKN